MSAGIALEKGTTPQRDGNANQEAIVIEGNWRGEHRAEPASEVSALRPSEEQHFPTSYWARRWGFTAKTAREWFREEYALSDASVKRYRRRFKEDVCVSFLLYALQCICSVSPGPLIGPTQEKGQHMERDARPTKRTPVQQAGAAKFSSIKRIQAKQVIQQAAASVGWPGTGIG